MITNLLRWPEGAEQFKGKVVDRVVESNTISTGTFCVQIVFTDGTWIKAKARDNPRHIGVAMDVTYENGKDTVP